jgi:hypothetical protein
MELINSINNITISNNRRHIKDINKIILKIKKNKRHLYSGYFNNDTDNIYIGYVPINIHTYYSNHKCDVKMMLVYLYLYHNQIILSKTVVDKNIILNNIISGSLDDDNIISIDVLCVMQNVFIIAIFINNRSVLRPIDNWRQYISLYNEQTIGTNIFKSILNNPGNLDYFKLNNNLSNKKIKLIINNQNIIDDSYISLADLYLLFSKQKTLIYHS